MAPWMGKLDIFGSVRAALTDWCDMVVLVVAQMLSPADLAEPIGPLPDGMADFGGNAVRVLRCEIGFDALLAAPVAPRGQHFFSTVHAGSHSSCFQQFGSTQNRFLLFLQLWS